MLPIARIVQVAPFFPASNVMFYVGTFIGERLLYCPSIGFCMLAAEAFMALQAWAQHRKVPRCAFCEGDACKVFSEIKRLMLT